MELPQEFYINYITRREKDLAALTAASQAKDTEVFKRVGHQIKGNADSFGFSELTAIANEIEKISSSDFNNKNDSVVLEKFSGWIAEKKKIYFS
ncbi:MAG: Hpt domain-containing protein [Bdellovibrionota bacterium]